MLERPESLASIVPTRLDEGHQEFDWNSQTYGEPVTMGKYTQNSIQTFDSSGKPKDSQSDNND